MSAPPPSSTKDSLGSPSSVSSGRSQYPFPRIDTSQRPNYGNRYNPRRDSAASVASSIGGPFDNAPQSATATSQNSLPNNSIFSLLSSPIVRTGLLSHTPLIGPAQRLPSTRDIPPVTLTTIPHVDSSVFKPYLTQIGSLFDEYQRAKAASEDAASNLFSRSSSQTKEFAFENHVAERLRTGPLSPSASSRRPSMTSPTDSPRSRRPSYQSSPSKRTIHTPAPLSTIPSVYSEENFQLENPRTFDIVSEHSNVIPPSQNIDQEDGAEINGTRKTTGSGTRGRKALHTNAILQEKLSWYMDTVEIHLISCIASASTSFFAALGSLKELEAEARDSVEQIHSLRSALKIVDEEIAASGLEILHLQRQRANLAKLSDAVSQLDQVVVDARYCELLVSQGNYDDANMHLDRLEGLIAGSEAAAGGTPKSAKLRDLRQLNVLQGMSVGIAALRSRIGKGFEARFIDALLQDLRQHIEKVPHRDTLQRWANASLRIRGDQGRPRSSPPAYQEVSDALKSELQLAFSGLNRSGHTAQAVIAYRESVMREVKSLIRRHLPSSNDEDAESVASVSTRGGRKLTQQEKSAILARNLRALDAETAEDLLVKVYTAIGEALRRIAMHIRVLLDVTSTLEQQVGAVKPDTSGKGSTNLMRFEIMQALDTSSLLGQAVDLIQNQVIKVLRVRSEQSTHLPLQQFLRYFFLNRLFADECEAVSSRSGEGLRDVVNTQVKDFVNAMADTERQNTLQVLDADKWDVRDLTANDQAVLAQVLQGMTKTPKAWTAYTHLWDYAGPSGEVAVANTNGDITGAAAEKAKTATIDEQRFNLTDSGITALHGINQFEYLMAAIPSLVPDVSQRLLEYLKAFNSRCVQLILGAGATRSAGLKNITTKHLALASQVCSFVVTLIPYLREFVRRQAPGVANALLPEFDKVKRLFQDHQASIHDKLVDIMSSRSNAHVKAMKAVDWADGAAQPVPSAFIEALAKETGTLHRVLSKHVPTTDLSMIMVPIFANYGKQWTPALQDAMVSTEAGRARLLGDVEYLAARLSKIDESGQLGSNLVDIVRSKKITPNKAELARTTVPNPRASLSMPLTDNEESRGQQPRTDGSNSADAATSEQSLTEKAKEVGE